MKKEERRGKEGHLAGRWAGETCLKKVLGGTAESTNPTKGDLDSRGDGQSYNSLTGERSVKQLPEYGSI